MGLYWYLIEPSRHNHLNSLAARMPKIFQVGPFDGMVSLGCSLGGELPRSW